MEYRSEIFREQFPLVKHSLCHLIYYRVLGQQYRETSLKSPFWTLTINAHLAQAVILWCMVFGTDDNPTHWKTLSVRDAEILRGSFRKALFEKTKFSLSSWNQYWQEIVSFRNEFIAHRELSYGKPVPLLGGAGDVAYVYDEWVRELISPDIFEEPPLKQFAAELQASITPVIEELLACTKKHENPELLGF